jgi:hypothetical protein
MPNALSIPTRDMGISSTNLPSLLVMGHFGGPHHVLVCGQLFRCGRGARRHFLSHRPPFMPHLTAPCPSALRRAGTLVPCSLPILHTSFLTTRPLLPFLWPTHALPRSQQYRRTHSTPRRAYDTRQENHTVGLPNGAMGKKDGNFQLKTPKGTRDCMLVRFRAAAPRADLGQGRALMSFCASAYSIPSPRSSSGLQYP